MIVKHVVSMYVSMNNNSVRSLPLRPVELETLKITDLMLHTLMK